jgi:ABC-type polysaccharide/polyol phosphate transport system ATPase subunit
MGCIDGSAALKKTSSQLRARLALAVVAHCKQAIAVLTHSNSTLATLDRWLNEKFLFQIAAQRDLFESLSRFLLAQSHYEKTELGICISTCQQAAVSLIYILIIIHQKFSFS